MARLTDPVMFLVEACDAAVADAPPAGAERLADLALPMVEAGLLSADLAAVVLSNYIARRYHRASDGAEIAARLLPVLRGRPDPDEMGALFEAED